jgi:hypothetical protein
LARPASALTRSFAAEPLAGGPASARFPRRPRLSPLVRRSARGNKAVCAGGRRTARAWLLHAYSGHAHVVTASIGERHRAGAEMAIEIVAEQSSGAGADRRAKRRQGSRWLGWCAKDESSRGREHRIHRRLIRGLTGRTGAPFEAARHGARRPGPAPRASQFAWLSAGLAGNARAVRPRTLYSAELAGAARRRVLQEWRAATARITQAMARPATMSHSSEPL